MRLPSRSAGFLPLLLKAESRRLAGSTRQTFIDTDPRVAFANVGLDLIRWMSYPLKREDHSAYQVNKIGNLFLNIYYIT